MHEAPYRRVSERIVLGEEIPDGAELGVADVARGAHPFVLVPDGGVWGCLVPKATDNAKVTWARPKGYRVGFGKVAIEGPAWDIFTCSRTASMDASDESHESPYPTNDSLGD